MRFVGALALISILTACGPDLNPSAAFSPSSQSAATGSVASPPRISPAPTTPAAPGTNLPDFACADASGGKTGVANTITARVSQEIGYDRFVLQFDSIVPTYTVKRQPKPVFSMGASGDTVTLSGTSGLLVTVHSATGATTFIGSTDIVNANYKVISEARQTQDFEGYVSWGLGLSKPGCMRVFTLDDPARLVVDLQQTSS
ncbi:MAG TPA: hypothetical protein VNA65_04645 [Candidatus Dormibacteraeota bacterium]|nr:hypothetical protein [Candidatus Dormibacteraeota bacterium]